MKVTTITCDRCGANVEGAAQEARVTWLHGGIAEYDMQRLDLCATCAGELRAWTKGAAHGHEVPNR